MNILSRTRQSPLKFGSHPGRMMMVVMTTTIMMVVTMGSTENAGPENERSMRD